MKKIGFVLEFTFILVLMGCQTSKNTIFTSSNTELATTSSSIITTEFITNTDYFIDPYKVIAGNIGSIVHEQYKDNAEERYSIASLFTNEYIHYWFIFNNNHDIVQVLNSIDNEQVNYQYSFEDINSDGFTDIITKDNGTLNDFYHIFLWNDDTKQYKSVEFKNFDILGYYEKAEDGSLITWLKNSGTDVTILTLAWEENSLYMIEENILDLENQTSITNHYPLKNDEN